MRFRKTMTFLVLATGLVFALPAWAQQKPFTQEQVSNMVRAGLGDDSGAELIEERGIDFAPSEDFIQTLKTAIASKAFLNAWRAAKLRLWPMGSRTRLGFSLSWANRSFLPRQNAIARE